MIKRFQNEIGVILGRNQSSVDKAVDIVTNTYTRSKSYPKLFTFSFECSTIWTEAHATVELTRIRSIRSKQARIYSNTRTASFNPPKRWCAFVASLTPMPGLVHSWEGQAGRTGG